MKVVSRKCNVDPIYVPIKQYRNSVKKKKVKSKMKLRTKRQKLISYSENSENDDLDIINWNNCSVVLADVMLDLPKEFKTKEDWPYDPFHFIRRPRKFQTTRKPAFQVYEDEGKSTAVIENKTESLTNFSTSKPEESTFGDDFNGSLDYPLTEFETSECDDDSQEETPKATHTHSPFSFVTSDTLIVLKETEWEQQQLSNIIVHKLSDNETLLQIKSARSHIRVYGTAQVELLCGKAKLHGHFMKPYEPVDVYSIRMMSLMNIKFETCCNSEHCALKSIQEQYGLEAMTALDNEHCAIFLVKHVVLPTIPGFSDVYKTLETSFVSIKKSVTTNFAIVETERCWEEYDCFKTFRNIMLDIVEECPSDEGFPIILTVGGKNTGKSSFNRYMINALLSSVDCVNYLECDIGQSEFTVSGLISLHEVRKPLLGPPFTHCKKPKYSAYFGEITPSDFPDQYVDCIQRVFKEHDPKHAPLIVNTMGWNQSIGLQLLMDIIRIVKPNQIVQMETDYARRNIPLLSPEYVNYNPGWKLVDSYQNVHRLNLMHITGSNIGSLGMVANNCRDLMAMSYLQKFVDNRNLKMNNNTSTASLVSQLCHMQPYKISVSDIESRHQLNILSDQEALSIFNCSLVGLCVKSVESEGDVMECLGVGLVRGVDPEKKYLYILSNLTTSEIQRVDCLRHGDVRVPKNLLLQQRNVANSMNLPYCSMDFNTQVAGGAKFKVYRKFAPRNNQNSNS